MLVVFFLIFIVAIPYLFFSFLSQEKKETAGILRANRQRFVELIDANMSA